MMNKTLLAICTAAAAALAQAAAYANPPAFQVEVVNDVERSMPIVVTNPTAIDVNVAHPVEVTPAPSSTTHMGVKASEHVVLVVRAVADASQMSRLLPDGTVESDQFVVPAGKVFVLTDVQAWVSGSDALNQSMLARIIMKQVGAETGRTVLRLTERFNADGFAGGDVSLTSGIVFGPGTTPEFDIDTDFIGFGDVTMMGYLAPAL